MKVLFDKMEKCCLCQAPFDDNTSQHKRKKLYGTAASEARKVLERISLQSTYRALSSYNECNSNAYLCNCCNSLAKSIERIEKDLRKKTEDIKNKLMRLIVNPDSLAMPVLVGNKRPSLTPQLDIPSKQACQSISTSQSTIPTSTSGDLSNQTRVLNQQISQPSSSDPLTNQPTSSSVDINVNKLPGGFSNQTVYR